MASKLSCLRTPSAASLVACLTLFGAACDGGGSAGESESETGDASEGDTGTDAGSEDSGDGDSGDGDSGDGDSGDGDSGDGDSGDGDSGDGDGEGLARVWTTGLGTVTLWDLEAETATTFENWATVGLDGKQLQVNVGGVVEPDWRIWDAEGNELWAPPAEVDFILDDHVVYPEGDGFIRAGVDGSDPQAYAFDAAAPDESTLEHVGNDPHVYYVCATRFGSGQFIEKHLRGESDVTTWSHRIDDPESMNPLNCHTPVGESLDGHAYWRSAGGDSLFVTDASGSITGIHDIAGAIPDWNDVAGPGPNGDDVVVVTDLPSGNLGYSLTPDGNFAPLDSVGVSFTGGITDAATGSVIAATSWAFADPLGLYWARLDGSGEVGFIESDAGFQGLTEYFGVAP